MTNSRLKRCPERIFIETDNDGDYHACPRGFHDAEYVRADLAATAMRDKCVDAIKSLRSTPHGAAYNNAVNDAIAKVSSLTLDNGETSERKQ